MKEPGNSAAVWLYVAKNGPCSVTEVYKAVGLSDSDASRVLRHMSERGRVVRDASKSPHMYRVTMQCHTPMGVSVGDLLEAVT